MAAKTGNAARKTRAGTGNAAASARRLLFPRKEKRGLAAAEILLDPGGAEIAALAEQVRQTGGAVIGAYREPLSGRAHLVAALPVEAVAPTPFQRDLSPAHVKRLAEKIEESGSFLDPLIVVRGAEGRFWTPNGSHRDRVRQRQALPRRGVPPASEKGRPVRRMRARGEPAQTKRCCRPPRGRRGCGQAHRGEAAGTRLQAPYLRSYVVARINPVRFHRGRKGGAGPATAVGAALIRMAAAAKTFDAASVTLSDLALVAAVASEESNAD